MITDEVSTFAEGLATREPFDLPLQLLPRLVDETHAGQRCRAGSGDPPPAQKRRAKLPRVPVPRQSPAPTSDAANWEASRSA